MVPPRKPSYRSDLFDASALTSIDAVENAVNEFSAIVNESNLERVLDGVIVNEPPTVVRLVLSSLSEDLVMSCFPTTAEGFGASLAWKILSHLSVLFLFAQSVPALHEKHHDLVKEAPKVLTTLTSKQFVGGSELDLATDIKKGKTTSQKRAKIARRIAAQTKNAVDSTPFEHLNIPIPETPDEVDKCVQIVLATQRSILEAYLESLRLPAVAASLKAAFLSAETTHLEFEEPSDPEAEAGRAYQPNDSREVSYSTLPSINSTLYRRRATGFGDWEVNITPRAERDLREYNRRDRKIFSVIVKKMRELSNGDFSPDNYKQINGGNVEVPIYEANLTEELRLVYQIDCAVIYDKKIEQQTLKIFGIYRDAQLTRGTFWNSMSRELGKKGQEYKDRCAQRQRAIGTEGHILAPATFPTHEAQFSTGTVPDLPSDDAEQIQSLLLKTVHFSQELLDNILADRDVAFVLQISPSELEIIEHPHSCYVLGRSGTGKSTTILYKMLMVEASSELSPPTERKIRQLFVSQSPILAEKVGEHFAKLLGGYRPIAVSENVKAGRKADRLLVADEENDWRSDLPKRYSDLEDSDFPLFLSFNQLCSMIEHDMLASDVIPTRKSTLTYDKFRREYWTHFPQPMRQGFEPSMVFSEFMGVIMGSEETLTGKLRYLDRNTYLNLGQRRQATFADQRERIYDLFEKYLNEKRHQGDTDAADRIGLILFSIFFQNHGVPGRKIDYLYVDETQDNLLIDTLLLRILCHNPNGLFWAGDTAQTISVGSSFRFNELKAFLFRIEGQRQKKHPEFSFRPAVPPREFQLTVNYRSHTGIVNCARSIIEVITRLWPDAIDVLSAERGTVDGLRPIFFTNWESESGQSKQFLFGDQPSGGPVELGAQQCILVRNNAAKKKLKELVGEIGLIMTLYESKGLEFNDVLLYNFFEDSGVTESQWRVVLNVIDNGPPAPSLDNMRHASVCSELKFLYVAITRARNNIWIADCSTKGEPMRTLWTSKDQVQNCVLGTDTPRFAISSTLEEWREQGRKLFDNKKFSQARLCYTRADMPHEAAVAQAYHLRDEASEMSRNSRREIVARKAALSGAAAAFMDCAKNDRGDAARAYFRTAGECFESAEDLVQAIAAYSSARHFGKVAELYRRLGKFDDAVATVQTYRQHIDPDIIEKVIGVARFFYFNKGQMGKASQLFVKPEEALAYLEERGMHDERATMLEALAKLSDAPERLSAAAEIHLQEGRRSKAIALFLQVRNTDRASDCVLQELWERFSFGVLPDTQNPAVSCILDLAAQIDFSLVSQRKCDEMSMFRAIANEDRPQLQVLGNSFLRNNNQPAALLCLDHYFADPPKIQTLPIEAVAQNLQVFLSYAKLLHHVAFNVDPCSSSAVRTLFGYTKEGESTFSIPRGTFIHLALPNPSSESSSHLTGSELRTVFQRSLRDRVVEKIRKENDMCGKTRAFGGLCLTFALFEGHCNRGDNCRQEHILSSAFDSRQYNLRVRIHLQQILIYQGLDNIDTDERRFWLSRLYDVLNPPSHQFGSVASLDVALIPEAQSGLQIVKEWIRDCVYALEFVPEFQFLTRLVQLAQLGFQFDGRHAMSYLSRGPFMMDPRKPLMYRRPPEGRYVVSEFVSALEDQHDWCLSAGVIFLRHVIMSRLNIQVGVLCDVAEHLCTALVVADRQRFGSIHGITLPKSWIVKRSFAGGLGVARDTNGVWLFARALAELLEPMYSGIGAGYLLFESKTIAHQAIGYMIRETFLARISKCLCLLAYNFRSDSLREFVWQSITSLRSRDPNRRFTALCSRYVNARSWPGIVAAVRASAGGSTHDEMVQILHFSRLPPIAVDGVRQIVYGEIGDIPRLLGAPQWIASAGSASFLPTADTVPMPTPEPTAAVDNEDADADEHLEDENAPIEMPSISEPEPRSEKELHSAATIYKLISHAHRRGEQRKKGMSKSTLASGLLEFFAECRGQSLTMDQSHRLYRVCFLGPLPHLLLCLDIVHTRAQKEKQIIIKELPTAQHEALENLEKNLTDVQRTLKQVIEIQKALNPTSEIHTRRNLSELKNWAEQGVMLLKALPFRTPPGVSEHLDIAYKGMLQPRKAVTRPTEPRPKLNTDEEDMY
ncbi:UvrD-like helicase ATP-binding domain-containing protein [Mycena venus]|uniref:UvrD-like helicase ATP-binding domain-containing protein n=1 Tax=Mycena venus TaxID=2733690 RepID=A0A8H6XFK1_9AGAR|nr:UvrD-like helicase ATP-binding domain-containing protein [Mycena venus]